MLAFAAVITREGNISGLEALGEGRGRRQVAQLINEISRGRLEPARYGADPIAVNLVWVVEHLTVKPKTGQSGWELTQLSQFVVGQTAVNSQTARTANCELPS